MSDGFERRLRRALTAREPRRPHVTGARAAAVLVPIVGIPEPTLILTLRTDTVRSHKGQISFPGGSIDPGDPSAEAAALREAHEEIGLDPASVRILGELDTTPTFVSGFVITPVVGWIDRPPSLEPNPAEVAEVLEVPISALTESARVEPGFSLAGRTYPTEAWLWKDHAVWGITARLLGLLLEALAAAGLADPPRPTSSPWPTDGTEAAADQKRSAG